MSIHIGKQIKKVYEQRGMKMSVFAEKIGTVPRNVYHIFESDDISVNRLKRIGEVLGYDFFQLLSPDKDVDKWEAPSPKYKKQIQKDSQSPMRVSLLIEVDDETHEEVLRAALGDRIKDIKQS